MSTFEGQRSPLGATQMPQKPTIPWQELNSLITTTLRLKLKETPAKALAPNVKGVVFAKTTDNIGFVFKKLIDCGILSMPVLDTTTNMFVAFVDMLDILAWLVAVGELPKEPTMLFGEWQRRISLFESTPCTQLLQHAQRHPWLTINRELPIQEAIDFMVSRHANRVGLIEPNGTFSSILTQHRIIKWLAGMDVLSFGPLLSNATLGELGVGFRKVVTIHRSKRVVDAFLTMYQQRLSGVAITNDAGALVGNISISDLKDIGNVGQNFDKLFMSCDKFLHFKTEGLGVPPILYATRNSSLKEVLGKFKNYFVHRVYIVEKNTHMLEGIVTPSDLLQLFSTTAIQGSAFASGTTAIPVTTGQAQQLQVQQPRMLQALREAETLGGLLPLLMNMAMATTPELSPLLPFEPSEYGTMEIMMMGPTLPSFEMRIPSASRGVAHIDVKETMASETKLPPGVSTIPPTTGQHA